MKLKANSLKRNKIDKPLARFIKKKGERTQISKIRNEKGKVTQVQRTVRDYAKQLHSNKMDNPEELHKFSGTISQD